MESIIHSNIPIKPHTLQQIINRRFHSRGTTREGEQKNNSYICLINILTLKRCVHKLRIILILLYISSARITQLCYANSSLVDAAPPVHTYSSFVTEEMVLLVIGIPTCGWIEGPPNIPTCVPNISLHHLGYLIKMKLKTIEV